MYVSTHAFLKALQEKSSNYEQWLCLTVLRIDRQTDRRAYFELLSFSSLSKNTPCSTVLLDTFSRPLQLLMLTVYTIDISYKNANYIFQI